MVAQFVDSKVAQAKPSGSAHSRNLSVTVGSGDALDVRKFHVNAKMSTIFEAKIVAVCENHDIDFEGVVGQSASFSVQGRGSCTLTGICNHFQQIGVEESGLSTYELTLVPTLWLLTQRRNHRMFQLMSEIDIVQKLLGEWGIDFDMRLSGTYKKRKYKVQYGETDETFIRRLLEEVGVSFYFEEGKLVLDDGPQRNGPRGPIPFRDKPTVADREHVTAVCVGRRLRPGKVTLRDHDYRKPPDYKLMATVSGGSGVETQMESFHYVPGSFLFDGPGGDTPMADFRGPYRTSEGEGTSLAQKRLDGARASAKTVSFKTNVLDLAPGRVMSVVDHPKGDVGKPLLVTESCFTGTHDGEWSHEVTTVGADVPYRPEVATPTPKVSGVESATVVGPPGEEIHVDEFGRVQVHFHWDRESQMNEKSSCWIHVVQPWAGTGFGGTALPRVGQEVIVDFLDGNPDRPVIIGRVYTNLEKTPYKLPDNKTQTGLKTNSTHKTGGYNELMFEDAAGKELVRMQAEKDLNKLVKNDEQVKIGRDREKKVARDDTHDVGRDRKRSVGRDESVHVGQDRTRQVGRDESVDVGQDQTKSIGRNRDITIGQDLTETVGRDLTKDVGSNERETTGQNRTISVGQNRTADIGLVDSTSVGEKIYIEVKIPEGAEEEGNDDLGVVDGVDDNFVQSTASLGRAGGLGAVGLAGGALNVLQGLVGGGAGGALGALAGMVGGASGGPAGAAMNAIAGMAGGGGDAGGAGAVMNVVAGAAQGGGAGGGGAAGALGAVVGMVGGVGATKGGGSGAGAAMNALQALVQMPGGGNASGNAGGGATPQATAKAFAGPMAGGASEQGGGPSSDVVQIFASMMQNGGDGLPADAANVIVEMLQTPTDDGNAAGAAMKALGAMMQAEGGGGGAAAGAAANAIASAIQSAGGDNAGAGAAVQALAGMIQSGGGGGAAAAAMNAIAGMMQGSASGSDGAVNAIAGMMQGGASGAVAALAGMAKSGSLPGLGGLTGILGGKDARGALATALGKAASAKFGEGAIAEKAPDGEQSEDQSKDSKVTPTSITMVHKKITITTGHGATITMDGAKVTIEADTIEFFAKKNIDADAKEKNVTIHAKTDIALNSDQTVHVATKKGVIAVNASGGNVAVNSDRSVTMSAAANFGASATVCTVKAKSATLIDSGEVSLMQAKNTIVIGSTTLATAGETVAHAAADKMSVTASGEMKIVGKPVDINP